MTDNDDPAPPRYPPSSDGSSEDPRGATRPRERQRMQWGRGGETAAHIAPTDPEVPSAKRRGALRRHRSLVGLTAVIIGLLSITLLLLYRASLRVGVRETGRPASDDDRSSVLGAAPDVVHENTASAVAPPPVRELGDDAPATSDNAPSGSASAFPRGPAPATSIIRTPPF